MNYTDEDLSFMYETAIKKSYMVKMLPRALHSHDGRTFYFDGNGQVTAIHLLYKSELEEARRLPDYIYDLHKVQADIYQAIMTRCQYQDGYKAAISAMHTLGLSEKVATRMLSDHGIHPAKVSINLWSLHKFTSLHEWIKMNLEKRSDIK